MMGHARYCWYLVKHKWYVFWECAKMGIPLLGLIHDWTKFMPCEWSLKVCRFGKSQSMLRDENGCYKPTAVACGFDVGWLHHIRRNAHHWQFWVVPEACGNKVLEIPLRYVKEMVADWRGAALAQGMPDMLTWYVTNKDNMILHCCSRAWIEDYLMVPVEARHLLEPNVAWR